LVIRRRSFLIEPAILVVGNDPNSAERLALYVKWDQQSFFQKRRNFAEIGKIALWMRTQHGGIVRMPSGHA
jgi:hypothetical protein